MEQELEQEQVLEQEVAQVQEQPEQEPVQPEEPDFYDRFISHRIFKPIRPLLVKYRQMVLYTLVTYMVVPVTFGLYWLFAYPLHLDPIIAGSLSWVIRTPLAYALDRAFVFPKTAAKGKGVIKEAASYVAARISYLFTEELILWIGCSLLHFDKMLVEVFAQVFIFFEAFIVSKFVVFKHGSRQ